MSYIIAFVVYVESTKEFPVQCFRTDLKPGDEVLVRRTDGRLRPAIISQLRYLNWDCAGRIECRKSEIIIDRYDSFIISPDVLLVQGVATADVFIENLRELGWVPVRSRQRMYRAVLANINETHVAYIFVRKNGVDLQVFNRSEDERIKENSFYNRSASDGRVVRHSLAHTTFNLYEGILRFSVSFLNNEADLDRYFIAQGSSDKRTEEQKQRARQELSDEKEYGIEVIGTYADDMLYGYHCK